MPGILQSMDNVISACVHESNDTIYIIPILMITHSIHYIYQQNKYALDDLFTSNLESILSNITDIAARAGRVIFCSTH